MAVSTNKRTRIQGINRGIILDAALEVFSAYGFRGSTIDQIAEKAGMSKPNLLYYFPKKEDIYVTVLEKTLEEWLTPFRDINPEGDPVDELRKYTISKMHMSASQRQVRSSSPTRSCTAHRRYRSFLAPIFGSWSMKGCGDPPLDRGRQACAGRSLSSDLHDLGHHSALCRFRRSDPAIMPEASRQPEYFSQAADAVLAILLDGIRPR